MRWRFDESSLPFTDTSEVDPEEGIVGQPVALEAMRFGLESDAPGQNIYVRGLSGTGRMTMVRSALHELAPRARRRLDRCYVHNFEQPDRPRLVTLPAGKGVGFRRAIREAAEFIENRLDEVFENPATRAQREAIEQETKRSVEAITAPMEKTLRANGLTLVNVQAGPVSKNAIFLLHDNHPVPPDQLRRLVVEGELTEAEADALRARIRQYSERLEEVTTEAAQAFRAGVQRMRAFVEGETRAVLDKLFEPILEDFPQPPVATFIGEVIADVLETRLPGHGADSLPDASDIYGVNVVCSREEGDDSPLVFEHSPTVANLVGSIEPEWVGTGQFVSNYRGVRTGALVQADGGFLVLDAADVLDEPGAWRTLMRVLRAGIVDIGPTEAGWPLAPQSLKPEPIDIEVRVILLGSSGLYYLLDNADPDFTDQFKVLADFDSEIERSEKGVRGYAGVIARICTEEQLPHFTAGAVAALAEHGARIASRRGKITARFGRIADIVREAAFVAGKADAQVVERGHVEETVRRTRYRASLPSARFRELVQDGTIHLQTEGAVVGQINGLAVIHAGSLSYGFPARLTATVGAGRAGVIDIEEAADLSGSIHTKGFHILGGLLRFILRTDHAVAFSASVAFEQSYGGIDGDSASGAEFCCLLSAMTGVPIRQGLAMTGAIDQHGRVQAIGGVNEKIDGYFDACAAAGLTGEQGVIIPRSNAGDLMLREDVVEACAAERFHVFAVGQISEALEILTGMPCGDPRSGKPYPPDSIFARAQERAAEFRRLAQAGGENRGGEATAS
ncbi:MAG: AAA family ATPase [Gammaproteobacteria bacterium]